MPSQSPLRKRQDSASYVVNAPRRRFVSVKVVATLCMALYAIFLVTIYFKISSIRNFSLRESAILSKSCWLSDSSTKNQEYSDQEQTYLRKVDRSVKDADLFRILCTSTRRKIKWGSYQLRCRDLKTWAQKCTKDVHIVTDISFEDIRKWRWLRSIFGLLSEEERIQYNSTIFVKSYPGYKRILPMYGNMFVDMVDEYGYRDKDIPHKMGLILQTEWQGSQVFPNHNYTVVEHWYNSFPADMARLGPPEFVPSISSQTNISIATVWNTKRSKVPTEGGCPKIKSGNISYACLDMPFDITMWYLKLFRERQDKCEMENILGNPQLGTGMLYYNVFRKFDALVVLAKNDSMKLEYGNVQRAVSQMRSGVPVLLEIQGKVLEDFAKRYNYTCTFRRYRDDPMTKRPVDEKKKFSTFDEAVSLLARPDIRKQCQEEGLQIVEDYSPSKIAQKFLRAVGYSGDFTC